MSTRRLSAVTHAVIRWQNGVIRILNERIHRLNAVVRYQNAVIGRLKATIAYQQRVIRYQAGVIRAQRVRIRQLEGQVAYYRGVVNTLGAHVWGHSPKHGAIMASIHSGRGIPGYAWGHSKVTLLQAQVNSLRSQVASLQAFAQVAGNVAATSTIRSLFQAATIGGLNAEISELKQARTRMGNTILRMERHSVPMTASCMGDLACNFRRSDGGNIWSSVGSFISRNAETIGGCLIGAAVWGERGYEVGWLIGGPKGGAIGGGGGAIAGCGAGVAGGV
jgi:uncharacterized coiled-coil protein SlyX